MKIIHTLRAILIWSIQLPVQLFFILTGVIVVPFAMPWKRLRLIEGSSKVVNFKSKKRYWSLYRLPKWALFWDNPEDGVLGDDSLRWWLRDCPTGDARDWKCRYIWIAIRNPANYTKRILLGCDIRKYSYFGYGGLRRDRMDVLNCLTINKKDLEIKSGFHVEHIGGVSSFDVKDKIGLTGWQFLKCGPYYHIYIVKRYGNSNRGFVLEFGNKFRLSHITAEYDKEIDYYKGFTFEINPFKRID